MPLNNPQQRKIIFLNSIEEDCTSSYDIDRQLGPFFDANEEEGEQDFDKDSRPLSQPVLEEEDKD